MSVLGWVGLMVAGLAVALWASRRTVFHASAVAAATKIPPFIVGVTLIAVGTDLPEIANSIIASVAGHGDLNVGASIGSTVTQATLVLGLLPLLAGPFVVGPRRVTSVGVVTVLALLGGAVLFSDGYISRTDAAVLIIAWIAGLAVVWRQLPPGAQPSLAVPTRNRRYHIVATLIGLAGVGIGAAAAVRGFVEIAEVLAVPEYLLAFFVASIGTSLPELIFDLTALRRGARDLAVGDLMGSSLIDATLSVGIGPLIAPTVITASLAVRGSIAAAGAIFLVVVILSVRARHDRWSGIALLGIYLAFYLVLL
ncbi:MAG: sodium:calcium antiporter [Acidimicrobiia bacterium]